MLDRCRITASRTDPNREGRDRGSIEKKQRSPFSLTGAIAYNSSLVSCKRE
ncbi:hypothetical protein CKA32_003180 [Geitlerinema sp. FC II]|nr:hypothetical protein CKA32_003180 [Geitlerinema sp. FC II]